MADESLILNLEGLDGATSWEEEAQDLEPYCKDLCEIDTAQYYEGLSSLSLGLGGQLIYIIPGIETIGLVWRFAFRFSAALESPDQIAFTLGDADGNAYILIQLNDGIGTLRVSDKNGDLVIDDSGASPYPYSSGVWHKIEVSVSGSIVTIKLNDVEVASGDAGIDDPLEGLDWVNFQAWLGVSAGTLWIDSAVIESDFHGVAVPAATMTLVGYAPLRGAEVPAASMLLTPHGLAFGPAFADIPAAAMRLLARNPAAVWNIPVALRGSAAVIYYCILTGADDGLDDAVLPISSFQAVMRDGDPSYLSCVIPNSVDYAADVIARTNGDIVIQKGVRFADGTEQMEEMARVNYESIQINRGARNDSLTLTGHKTVTSSAPKERTVAGVSFYGLQADGKRCIRSDVDLFLRCGDTCIYGDGANDYFIVESITYIIAAKPAMAFMEVLEA